MSDLYKVNYYAPYYKENVPAYYYVDEPEKATRAVLEVHNYRHGGSLDIELDITKKENRWLLERIVKALELARYAGAVEKKAEITQLFRNIIGL